MNVLVRIEMGRVTRIRSRKACELTAGLRRNRRGVVQSDDPVRGHPRTVLRNAHSPRSRWRPTLSVACSRDRRRGFCRSRPADHQAGAGHDAPRVRLMTPAVDPGTQTEVVRVDDQATGSQSSSQPQSREQRGQHRLGPEVLLGDRPRRPAVARVVGC